MSQKVKKLFTPGPITTSKTVKEATLFDKGSRDDEFIEITKKIQTRLLAIAKVKKEDGYECILMQGSGTFSIESVISSVVPENGKALLIINGAYGRRFKLICDAHKINFVALEFKDNELPDLSLIESTINEHKDFTHLITVHCETTTGIMNPILALGNLARKYNLSMILDSMSAFGGVQFDMRAYNVDFLISSANKCIQGIPGFAFVIANRKKLEATKNIKRTLTLHLYDQWAYLDSSGQFRFTPPVQSLLAFNQALIELENEGGVQGRINRYKQNHALLCENMTKLGFKEYVDKALQGHTLVTFCYPEHPNFNFNIMYQKLSERGLLIFPGKLTSDDTIRIGCIGNIYPKDVQEFTDTLADVLIQMDVKLV